jgi:flagella basal body P-ring formation protein FlgA
MTNNRSKIAPWSPSAVLLATVVAILALCGFCQAEADVQTCVSVKSEAWIKGEKIYLEDIARIEGPAQLRKRLGAIYLAHAPSPGAHKTLHRTWIESKVRSKRWLPENTVLKIPEHVRIDRASQLIQEENLLRRYTSYIASELKGRQTDFRVSRFRVIGNGHLPEGDIRIELSNQADGRLMGHVSLNAIVRVNGKIERRVVLSGWIDRFEKVVCTLRQLERHSLVTENDLCTARRNIAKLPANVAKSMANVVGKRMKRAVKAGTVLLANMVEEPPLIEKGDRVTVVAQSPCLIVTVPGIAQGKGSAGDYIRIRNSMSKKDIVGCIIDASTVRVKF